MKVSGLWKHATALSVVSHVVGETHGAVLVPRGITKLQLSNTPLCDVVKLQDSCVSGELMLKTTNQQWKLPCKCPKFSSELTPEYEIRHSVCPQLQHSYSPLFGPMLGSNSVFVLVEDQNDNVPLADKPAYSGHVLENCPTHTSVLRVSASDADQGPGERINFNITAGNTAGHFAIDDTGLIYTTTDQIDREEQEEYVLEIF
ncbi:bahd acyltransferase [Homalodisca vitripennis]|nr:bahd acyltransferase [Homalodisca vitripennis]